MTMVRGMRQKLFRRACGRLMGRDDPPEEKALVREWTRERKSSMAVAPLLLCCTHE